MEERILTRKDKTPFTREGFPERLSLARRRRDPVLLVPGFMRFFFFSSAFRRRLKDLDYEVYTIRLPNFAVGDIRKGARILMDKMEEMRVLLGVRRLSLIGQGMGGMRGSRPVKDAYEIEAHFQIQADRGGDLISPEGVRGSSYNLNKIPFFGFNGEIISNNHVSCF